MVDLPPVTIWSVVSRPRSGGPWKLLVDDLGGGPAVPTFSHQALAQRYATECEERLAWTDSLYLVVPMQATCEAVG